MSETATYLEILRREFQKRVDKNSRYSLRSFAKVLGIHPSALSRVLSQKAELTPVTGVEIAKKLKLEPDECRRFVRSILDTREKLEQHRLGQLLDAPSLRPTAKQIAFEDFERIASLPYLSLLALAKTSNFDLDERSVASRLGVSAEEAREMLATLQKLELLGKDTQVALREEHLNAVDHAKTSDVRKKLQKEILSASIRSLESTPFEHRMHYAMTVAIDSTKLEIARERICRFMEDLADELECDQRDSVYQLALSFFPVHGNL